MVSLETWIGLRYLRAKKRNGFMSFITMISIIGIALGVTALITVLSVMNGFQKEIRGQLLNVAPHAEIGYYDNGNGLGWQNLHEIVKDKKEIFSMDAHRTGNQFVIEPMVQLTERRRPLHVLHATRLQPAIGATHRFGGVVVTARFCLPA